MCACRLIIKNCLIRENDHPGNVFPGKWPSGNRLSGKKTIRESNYPGNDCKPFIQSRCKLISQIVWPMPHIWSITFANLCDRRKHLKQRRSNLFELFLRKFWLRASSVSYQSPRGEKVNLYVMRLTKLKIKKTQISVLLVTNISNIVAIGKESHVTARC